MISISELPLQQQINLLQDAHSAFTELRVSVITDAEYQEWEKNTQFGVCHYLKTVHKIDSYDYFGDNIGYLCPTYLDDVLNHQSKEKILSSISKRLTLIEQTIHKLKQRQGN